MELSPDFFAATYLVATLLFILGLKGMSSPKRAVAGNSFAMLGMILAVGVTLLRPEVGVYTWIVAGIVAGGLVGSVVALRIQMTAMPQLVAILHSLVGLAAVLVAWGTYFIHHAEGAMDQVLLIELVSGSIIGAITFSGSLVAFGKLQELLSSSPLAFRGQHILNALLALASVVMGVIFAWQGAEWALVGSTITSLLLGALLVLPIGGADMPVIVSMLNSYSGWAASATGFTLQNYLLITTGALVGSSGAILSYIMCKAMNRSILNVVFGGFGTPTAVADAGSHAPKGVKSAAVDDMAFVIGNSSKVIIVPGYGMAVAQAQHAIQELYEVISSKGIDVRFAIHPVAGRMPGHMNVLLAEAEIPYESVSEMEEINREFPDTDVVFIIGANDVVNPAAKNDKTSPLYGMPILDAYRAKQVFVNKRSMKAGYAGVDNSLFYMGNCCLVFGDAKTVCESLVTALKE